MKTIIIARGILHAIGNQNSLFGRGSIATLPARTSEEILNLHGVHHADMIITEENLPQMGGANLCSAIRSDKALKQVSIIMACERKETAAASGVIKANGFVKLPADPVEIFSMVADLLIIPQRKALRVLLTARFKGETGAETFMGICHNISISGMLLDTNCRLDAGKEFTCSFTIARREVSMDCRVVRSIAIGKRWQCAAVFVSPDTRSLIIIDQYVKNQIGH